jgi:phospholipid/cholesterol/gamma-HCH transport system substrate-binding protein
MDLNYNREATVGTLVIVAAILFFVGTTWLSGRSVGGRNGDYWKIQFNEAGNLKQSSVVRVSGVPVGKVEHIDLVEVGKVLVAVSLNEKIVPKVDATAMIEAVGFVGDAAIEFDPGRASQPLSKDKVIIGKQAPGLTDRAAELAYKADSLLVSAQEIVNEETAKQLRVTLSTLQGTLKAAQRTMEIYGNPDQGPTAEITKTLVAFRQLSARLDSTLVRGKVDTLTSNLAAMTTQFAATGARLDTLVAGMNRGQGTLGKFVTDSGLYYDIRELTQGMKKLLDELAKHPGKVPVTVKLF